jgi:hypothetical protein
MNFSRTQTLRPQTGENTRKVNQPKIATGGKARGSNYMGNEL